MTDSPTPKTKFGIITVDGNCYRAFLQRKVDAARRSQCEEPGLSSEEIETEFAGKRTEAADRKVGEL